MLTKPSATPRAFNRRPPFSNALGTAILISTLSSPGLAQSTGEEARLQYRKASEAKKAQNWHEARELLLDLWSRSKTYDVAGSLGEVELRLENYPAAAQYFAFALEHAPPREKSETIVQLERALEAMKERVGTVRIEIQPDTADLRIDGQPLQISPLPPEVFVKPGLRTFAALDGEQRAVERIDVAAGQQYQVVLRVPEDSRAGLPELGITNQQPTPAPPTDTNPRTRSLVPVYVGAGLTAAGLGAWVGFGFATRSARSDVDAYSSRISPSGCANESTDADLCGDARTALDRERRNALFGNIGLGVAAGASLATLGYLLFWPEPKDSQVTGIRVRPELAVDATGTSFGLSGEF